MSFNPKHVALLLMVVALSWAGCQGPVVYEEHQALPPEGWPQNQKLVFQTEITDTASLHELYLDIRNTTGYEYRNLFLYLDITFPEGTILRDTIEATLAEPSGKWIGKGFGAIKTNRFLFRDQVWFPQQGTYTFILQHGMREQTLEGVSDIGIRIERK
ncbi:MAG: gliding motility lipoprotein GldH [Bacteroidales bacterium]